MGPDNFGQQAGQHFGDAGVVPGMSGLDLQAELNKRKIHLPMIFITGHGDVPMAVEAICPEIQSTGA